MSEPEKQLVYNEITGKNVQTMLYWIFEVNSELLIDDGEAIAKHILGSGDKFCKEKAATFLEGYAASGNKIALNILSRAKLRTGKQLEDVRTMYGQSQSKLASPSGQKGVPEDRGREGSLSLEFKENEPAVGADPPTPKP